MKNSNLTFISDYFDNLELKKAFDIYLKKKFGLDFKKARDKNIDFSHFIPFSAFDSEECIASTVVFVEKILINGEYYNSGHLEAVGTVSEYQRKGIQKQIWENVKEYANENDIKYFYLSTSYNGSIQFYRKLGFERQYEHAHIIELPSMYATQNNSVRKLDVNKNEDWDLLKEIASKRCSISDRIYIDNLSLLLFTCLYNFPHKIYYIEELNSIIIFEQVDNKIVVYDVIGHEIPNHDIILQYLPLTEIQFIEYRFYTDKININKVGRIFIDDCPVMVSNNFPLRKDVIFSFTMYA